MGVVRPGVHYLSEITWVRTLTGVITSAQLDEAVHEARMMWARTDKNRSIDEAPVLIEPGAGATLVKVALERTQHDVRPALGVTRSAPDVVPSTGPRE